MTRDIILGRNKRDTEKYGTKGVVYLAKQFVTMGQTTSVSNKVFMDVSTSHVVFVCGKRGSGKSYTMGVIAEGMADLDESIKKNISTVILDTMGIYWTMKYPNRQDPDLLNAWDLTGHALDNVIIFTPAGYFNKFKEKGIPTDYPFSIIPSELSSDDWAMTFEIDRNSEVGVFIEKIINEMKEEQDVFGIEEIIEYIKKQNYDENAKNAAINRFNNTRSWGLFSKEGTKLEDLVIGGKVTVLDVSAYATIPNGWAIKALVVGLVSQKLFTQRMLARRDEEFRSIQSKLHYFGVEEEENKMPLVWIVIDEAHEFLPREGSTAATDALKTLLREGRQPGVSLILATQQPGKIHTDVMTQSDIILSHRITSKLDIEALGMLLQSYMGNNLNSVYNALPRIKGSAILIDDSNERMFPVNIRPRFSWHGGGGPHAMSEKENKLKF